MDQTKDIGGESIGDLRFADDISLLAKQEKGLGLQETLTGVAKVSKNGHEDKHTEYRMSIFGGGKQEVSPGGRRTGIGANGELCVSIGGIISTQEGTDKIKDVERRIGLARGTWQALGKVWNSK